jgi:hypothetical protein
MDIGMQHGQRHAAKTWIWARTWTWTWTWTRNGHRLLLDLRGHQISLLSEGIAEELALVSKVLAKVSES